MTYLGYLGQPFSNLLLPLMGFQLLAEFRGQPLLLSVDLEPGEQRGLRAQTVSVPWSVNELPFHSLACITCPNWGVMGGKPAPGTTLGCFGTCSE